MSSINHIFNDVIDLVYPRTCAGCGNERPVRDGIFCVACLVDLPETNYHLIPDNPLEQHFWGRIPLQSGSAMLFFIPGGRTQKLLHNIKYCGHSHLAVEAGRFYGRKLVHTPRFGHLDCIVPVPLHWRKQLQRGFNQSEAFGRGLAETMQLPLIRNVLIRSRATQSQTSKSRLDRVTNLAGAFEIKRAGQVQGKHVLLIDDVLTTGATLESCALKLLEIGGCVISITTLACGRL